MPDQDPGAPRPAPAAADPAARVELFRKARAVNPGVDLGDFLPPPGSAARAAALVELIGLDLEHRAKAGQPTRLEPYLRRFAADLSPAAVPVILLYEEYRVRHRYADAPPVGEYRARFPARYEEFRRYVERHPVEPPPPPPPPPGTVRPSLNGPRPFEYTPSDFDETRPPAASPLPPTSAPAPAGEVDEADYKVLKVIGKGAYGKVFLAEAPGGVPVALKRLLRGIDHPAGQSERDALEAIKKLSHPYLIQVHQFWVEKDQLYIVMELAEGSLADRLAACQEQGKPGVPVEELLPYFAEAAEALDFLHTNNVSHRDVKPQNLLYLRGHAKVADFGLARTHSHQMTTVRHECGTPLFMAPEVWRKKVSLHSDQYSLAASYVTARLGRPLFETEYIDQLIVRHLEHTPDLAPLPAAERRVLLRALAKKPEDRFPSCAAFVAALKEAVCPPPRLPGAVPRRAALAAAVAVGCGLAYGLFRLFAPPPPAVPDVTWQPAGWAPAAGTEVVTDRDGKRLYRQVERSAGGSPVVAVLVPAARTGDPPSFYLTRDKVTNRVFAAAWAEAEADPESALNRYRRAPWDDPAALLPGVWRQGARDIDTGKPLGSAGDQLDVPVVGVTALEAAVAADQLGGRLPTYDAWLKATGFGDDSRAGPAGDPPFDPARVTRGERHGPWPVTRETADASIHGVRQLVSNGMEWTRDTRDGRQLTLLAPRAGGLVNPEMRVVGKPWDAAEVLTFKGFKPQLYDWTETAPGIGFRVALEQP